MRSSPQQYVPLGSPTISGNRQRVPADRAYTMRTTKSLCGRFVMLDGLHIDRKVFESLERWAKERGIQIQDAIQLALCAVGDDALGRAPLAATPPSSARMLAPPPSASRIG